MPYAEGIEPMGRKKKVDETEKADNKQTYLNRLTDAERSRLEALTVLQETGIQFSEF
jgi:hypothetical protein